VEQPALSLRPQFRTNYDRKKVRNTYDRNSAIAYDDNSAANTSSQYDQSAVIRLQKTIPARDNPPHRYDRSSGQTTTGEKYVTVTNAEHRTLNETVEQRSRLPLDALWFVKNQALTPLRIKL
jgi:hypothetical protein